MNKAFARIKDAHHAYQNFLSYYPNPPTAPRIVSRRWCILFTPQTIWERNKLIHRTRLNETIGNSGSNTYATLETASYLYKTEVLKDDVDIHLTFKAKHQRRKTRIGAFLNNLPASTVFRHRRNHLPKEAFTTIEGIPTVTPEYLILEYLAQSDCERGFVGAESLVRMLCKPNRMRRQQTEERRLKLLRRLRQIVNSGAFPYATCRILQRLPFIGPWSESVAESRFKAQLFMRGFPSPEQQRIIIIDGHVFFVDAAWLRFGIFAEVDGALKYNGPNEKQVWAAQQRREALLLRVFKHVVRFSWDDISEGDKFELLAKLFPPGIVNV